MSIFFFTSNSNSNNVIWYREISLFHTLPFLSYWKIYKFHLFTDVVDDWGWKHFAKCKRYTDAVNDNAKKKRKTRRNRWMRWCNNRSMRFVDMIFLVVGLIYSTSFTGIFFRHFFSQVVVTNEMIHRNKWGKSVPGFEVSFAIENVSTFCTYLVFFIP